MGAEVNGKLVRIMDKEEDRSSDNAGTSHPQT